MKKKELFKLFSYYKIYPKECYKEHSPVKVFQKLYPDNYFSKDLDELLKFHNYKQTKRGADLPWWGENYFKNVEGFRILIVSQDSLVPDAGSIVLFSQLFSEIKAVEKNKYDEFENELTNSRRSFFNSWKTIQGILNYWNLDFNFLYITDASKVYNFNSWKDFDFDKVKSKELLEDEIDLCNPDLIILLGRNPLILLDQNLSKDFTNLIMDERIVKIMGRNCIVSPFLVGMGKTQSNFKLKIKKVKKMLNKIKNKN
ncbi:MAG: hypothetical protein PHT51_04890 [Patescibacteria group bacterium]|nr:hypothetical protein [Patescibacteria group bacterium]MDD4610782.1 hypothetical protein [Patescibacteria group bacterium]